jgi:hypothetical protein
VPCPPQTANDCLAQRQGLKGFIGARLAKRALQPRVIRLALLDRRGVPCKDTWLR